MQIQLIYLCPPRPEITPQDSISPHLPVKQISNQGKDGNVTAAKQAASCAWGERGISDMDNDIKVIFDTL